MAENKEPSFGRLVFGKAYGNTKRLFADKVKDTIFGGILALPGGLISLYRYGVPVEMESALNFAAATFGPIGFVVVVVFLWNLWLAPAELAYDAWRSALTQNIQTARPAAPPINWSIWQKRSEYTVAEFAAILAKDNPTDIRISDDANAYSKLLMEELRSKKLAYIPRYYSIEGHRGSEIPIKSDYTKIQKSTAIAWANAQNIDVSHIK